jgi:hypothetical protein
MDELKRRLEILLGAKPEPPVDASERTALVEQTQNADRRQRIAEAGGQLLAAAVRLLGELLPPAGEAPIATLVRDQLAGALDTDATGRPVLSLTLPDREVLDGIARSLASLLPGPSALRAAVN